MTLFVLEHFPGLRVSDGMLEDATRLFNEHYATWSQDIPQRTGSSQQPGERVTTSSRFLRRQLLTNGGDCTYVRARVGNKLVGHVFACRWAWGGRTVCWISQLLVHTDFRKQYLATRLLQAVRLDGDDIYGILSAHPAACLGAAKAFGGKTHARGILLEMAARLEMVAGVEMAVEMEHKGAIVGTVRLTESGTLESLDLHFLRKNAVYIMQLSPVDYVRRARLPARLLPTMIPEAGATEPSSARSFVPVSAYTNFFIDRFEPLRALQSVVIHRNWPLGGLREGHEFLVLMEAGERSIALAAPEGLVAGGLLWKDASSDQAENQVVWNNGVLLPKMEDEGF